MSIQSDFLPYLDGNNLMAPNPVPAGQKQGSDNGPMFTGEYFCILLENNQPVATAAIPIQNCISSNGLLNRTPGVSGQEGPDDYYAVLNASKQLGNTTIPRQILSAMIHYLGFLNNVNPGTKTWQSFLVRQPQLVAAAVSAAYPSLRNPVHYAIRLAALPLYLVAAGVIATSCMTAPTTDTDSRRLSWHLQKSVSQTSLLCYLASKLWYRRLYKDYGPEGMRAVAAIYYQPQGLGNNPYSKYWVN